MEFLFSVEGIDFFIGDKVKVWLGFFDFVLDGFWFSVFEGRKFFCSCVDLG